MPKKTKEVKKDYKEVAMQGVNITYLTDVAHITAKATELGISKGEVLLERDAIFGAEAIIGIETDGTYFPSLVNL